MKSSKKSTVQTIIFMIIVVALIFGCFYMLQSRAKKKAEQEAQKPTEQTEVEKILQLDINSSYPQTPRAVLKLYSRILECLHNEDLVPVEIEGLCLQMRLLFDDEFLENNPEQDHIDTLISEVAEYDMLERTIASYQIESAISVDEWSIEGSNYARLAVCYNLKEGKQFAKVYEEFLFRKDEVSRWKIVGWRKIDKSEMEN